MASNTSKRSMKLKRDQRKSTTPTLENNHIRVAELFAGVGGFRVGFEKASKRYKTVWFNQWEPAESMKAQYAWQVYCKAFDEDPLFARLNGTNDDIASVQIDKIPDHDLLVGGFPCQDYSVAKPLSQSAGINGKKGVLWWSIHRILSERKRKTPYLLLENVDRLLKSPAVQRGRDFAIILATLSDLGYATEWRVINAADYGMPQRRRRVYLLAYHESTPIYKDLAKKWKDDQAQQWLKKHGLMAAKFPISGFKTSVRSQRIEGEPHEITKNFRFAVSPFGTGGVMIERTIVTADVEPIKEDFKPLRDIIHKPGEVPLEYLRQFLIPRDRVADWKVQKGAKAEERIDKRTGFKYKYTEGSMPFPDPLERPSRTIVTAEGGTSPSRFKHVIKDYENRLRRLTPVELERLNMFPDNHTSMEGISDTKRAFFMGNALVVGIVERIGKELAKRVS
ncbi:MAG: DNA (cytosine-5-)-methyltransferase [Minisyncoccota bacterium]